MPSIKVSFRMHDSGWLLILICMAIGIWLSGWKAGVLLGGLLLASLLLHEAGHMLAANSFGVPVYEFGLMAGGAYTRRSRALRRRDEVLISAAGPAMNLCLALPFLLIPGIGIQLALGNLALCLINLLPIPASDGDRILQTIWGPAKAA